MNNNFLYSIVASGKDMGLFFINLFHNNSFLGFAGGMILSFLVTGIVLTKNPKRIPIILKYSEAESFQKLAKRDKNGTYLEAYSHFLKTYTRVKTLFLMAAISFSVMFITAILIYKV